MNAIISDKHFVSYLVVMVYFETALSFIISNYQISLFSESDSIPVSNKVDVE